MFTHAWWTCTLRAAVRGPPVPRPGHRVACRRPSTWPCFFVSAARWSIREARMAGQDCAMAGQDCAMAGKDCAMAGQDPPAVGRRIWTALGTRATRAVAAAAAAHHAWQRKQ